MIDAPEAAPDRRAPRSSARDRRSAGGRRRRPRILRRQGHSSKRWPARSTTPIAHRHRCSATRSTTATCCRSTTGRAAIRGSTPSASTSSRRRSTGRCWRTAATCRPIAGEMIVDGRRTSRSRDAGADARPLRSVTSPTSSCARSTSSWILHRRRQEGRRDQPLQGPRRDEPRAALGNDDGSGGAHAAAGARRRSHRSGPDVHDAHGRSGRTAPEVHRRQRAGREESGCVESAEAGDRAASDASDLQPLAPTTDMTDFALHQHPVNIEDEMKRSYMDYAMSVIIGRALPDARDGLKPAHRRVLYGMKTMGLAANARLSQVREDRRRGDGQFPPSRRRLHLRHARPHGAGLQHALPAGGRPGQLRIDRRRSAGRDAVHRSAAAGARRRDDGGSRQGDRRLHAQLRRDDRRADRPPDAVSESAGQRLGRHRRRHGDQRAAAQPPRGHRRLHLADREHASARRRQRWTTSRAPTRAARSSGS